MSISISRGAALSRHVCCKCLTLAAILQDKSKELFLLRLRGCNLQDLSHLSLDALHRSFYGVLSLVLIVLSSTSDLGLNWDVVGPICESPWSKMFVYDVVMTS